MRRALEPLWALVWGPVLLAAALLHRRRRRPRRLYWGPEPLVNLKYLSDAMRDAGYESTTLVTHDYEIFRSFRFDAYHADIKAHSRLPGPLRRLAGPALVFLHLLRNFDVAHLPFSGGPLGSTPLAPLEPHLLRLAGIRTVMLPYGADFWRYSWMTEALMRHAMLLSYPDAGRHEDRIERRVKRWLKHADVVVPGLMVEGTGRWDVLVTNYLIVDAQRVPARSEWRSPGADEPVRIMHAPNHRGVKGTEFILDAVERVRAAGHSIELVLLEGRANEEVLAEMRAADICIDHCVGSGYGLFAIEAMASGAVVMANLEDEQRLGVHRHFGWLNQCPIVSANIDELEQTLVHLIERPQLRAELGQMGVEYVRRFHSPQTAQHLFGSIYRHLAGEEVDLLRLFHPLSSEYMRRFEPLRPPLRRNRPVELL